MAWFNLSLFGGWGFDGCVLVEGSGRLSPNFNVGRFEGGVPLGGERDRLGVDVPPGVSSFLIKTETASEATVVSID